MSPYLESLCLLVSCIVAGKIYHYLIKPEHFSVTDFSNFSIANEHYYNCPNNLYSSSFCHFHHGAPDVNPLPILTLRFVFAVAVIIHPTDPILPRSPPTTAPARLASSHWWGHPSHGLQPLGLQPYTSARRQYL